MSETRTIEDMGIIMEILLEELHNDLSIAELEMLYYVEINHSTDVETSNNNHSQIEEIINLNEIQNLENEETINLNEIQNLENEEEIPALIEIENHNMYYSDELLPLIEIENNDDYSIHFLDEEVDESIRQEVSFISYLDTNMISFADNFVNFINRSPPLNFQPDVKRVLTEEAIENVELKLLKQEDINSIGDKNCLTCYDNFVSTDLVRILPCKHLFHRSCIDTQLLNISHECPYCGSTAGESKCINIK
uniref:RING-type domain-containing protein n=1 Tax=viral metagenome TaxID=1070528 RepID=A0A6C0LT91_9ZZZZ